MLLQSITLEGAVKNVLNKNLFYLANTVFNFPQKSKLHILSA